MITLAEKVSLALGIKIKHAKRQYTVFNPDKSISYEYAKLILLPMKLKNSTDYYKYAHSPGRNVNLPVCPELFFKNRGWKGWDDFLGSGFLSYEDAKKEMLQYELSNRREFRLLSLHEKKTT